VRQSCEVATDPDLPAGPRPTGEASYGDWSDAALVAAVVGRSEEAYVELYRRHRASIAAVAGMMLANGPGCDEVVDDVFVEVWLSPDHFDAARGSVLGFLRLKARCRSIDVLRSDKSRTRREERDCFVEHDTTPEVDDTVLVAERADELRGAVASLPLVEREAIHLAFFGGMSYRAVAVHLNVAEGTVKSRIRKGLRRLSLSGSVLVHHDAPWPTDGGRSPATRAGAGVAVARRPAPGRRRPLPARAW
jgi:RNA polymerase sigma-70 factor (ECF subfamily)